MQQKEEKCVILDFLSSGYPDRRHPEPIAQALGTSFFTLLELVPREDVELKPESEVYIGEGKRDDIKFIKGALEYSDLTNFARSSLSQMVESIIKNDESRIIDFFNKSGMITPRMHQIQLLPGVGKKHLVDLLDERKKKPFESLKDITDRVKLFPDPVKAVVRRIMLELEGDEKYSLFVYKAKKRY